LWPLNKCPAATCPALEELAERNMVVLGAGITVALVAWHLAGAGVNVVLVDKRDVVSGGTSASTCLLDYGLGPPLHGLVGLVGEELRWRPIAGDSGQIRCASLHPR
jgi:glycerol-3-phosphate dehydrogenase